MKVVQRIEGPASTRAKTMSRHQTGFRDVIATDELMSDRPAQMALIGCQSVEPKDFDAGLPPLGRGRVREALRATCDVLHARGIEVAKGRSQDTLLAIMAAAARLQGRVGRGVTVELIGLAPAIRKVIGHAIGQRAVAMRGRSLPCPLKRVGPAGHAPGTLSDLAGFWTTDLPAAAPGPQIGLRFAPGVVVTWPLSAPQTPLAAGTARKGRGPMSRYPGLLIKAEVACDHRLPPPVLVGKTAVAHPARARCFCGVKFAGGRACHHCAAAHADRSHVGPGQRTGAGPAWC